MVKPRLLLIAALPLLLGTKDCGDAGDSDGDTSAPDPFEDKLGNWTGNFGCNLGTATLSNDENDLLDLELPVDQHPDLLYTDNPNVISFRGTYTIMNSTQLWDCELTCGGPTQMTLDCVNEDVTLTCTEVFTKARGAAWTYRASNLRTERHGR